MSKSVFFAFVLQKAIAKTTKNFARSKILVVRKKMTNKLDIKLSTELEPYRNNIEATIKPYIEIKITDNDRPTLWESKIGGYPYLPKYFEYPKSDKGEYLYLLAQINFAECPSLESFPNKGILQFYIAADDEFYGADFDDPRKQDGFRIVYFSDVDKNENNIITNFDFLPKITDESMMPFSGCCALEFLLSSNYISINDYQFNIFSLDDVSEDLWDKYEEVCDNGDNKIGGYPAFIQQDPRSDISEDEEEYILLLQIISIQNKIIDILWGDRGIGNFFIKKSALEKLDFSDVLYNWDCS